MFFRYRYRYLCIWGLATYAYINTAICRVYDYFHLDVKWYEAYFIILLITLFAWESNRLIHPLINKWFPAAQHIIKHAVAFCSAGFIMSALLTVTTDLVFDTYILHHSSSALENPLKLTLIYVALINLLFHLLNTIFVYQQEYRKKITESETLKRMHAQAELHAIKQQINPHFLFNNLNVLSGLVLQKKDEANQFIEAFSQVYMHILRTHNRELISLEDELNFLTPYAFLLQQRFPDAIQIETDIPDEFRSHYIIPVAVQMLVENVIKHNILSPRKPMLIRLYVKEECLVVENTWQPKTVVNGSPGTGLKNIEKRYELATGKKIAVHSGSGIFSASLPLIEINAYESTINHDALPQSRLLLIAIFCFMITIIYRKYVYFFLYSVACVFICILSLSCHQQPALFTLLSSSTTGIVFSNTITENDSVNPIDLEFLYNGGGVAVGDFNNDGLPDLYFTASTTSNKLYINKGHFSFTDVTEEAGVTGAGRWCNAASVVDINNDGLADIYVCSTIKKDVRQRRNLLYINQGVNKNGVPAFKEMAHEYHIDDTSFNVHAAFFDYDNDGDLDMYLVTTKLANRDATRFSINNNIGDTATDDYDKLYRNDWDSIAKHPVFTDVSRAAGIAHPGYGLGIAIADINRDGLKDIYVTNDFYGSDLLYMNNGNGTFTEKLRSIVKHTSQNAMGNDISDMNNDGLADIIAVDMNPEDNYRKKKNMNGNNYFIYQNMMNGVYMLQYVRNTLQLNEGARLNANDSIGDPVFSDVGFLAGVAATDWSWNPSIADFDNDGNRDILITNGYPRDVTDHDFAAFRQNSGQRVSKKELIDQIPQIKIPNYAFKNKGGLTFEKVTAQWGMETPSFSNGAVYVDLDNDGDLDYVVNNINQPAFVYENTTNSVGKINKNYLSVLFEGDKNNRNGLGAIATIYYAQNQLQVYENSPYRGYLSTVDNKAFFGLDTVKKLDSIVIEWYNGKKQMIPDVSTNQLLRVNITNAKTPVKSQPDVAACNLFTDVTASRGVQYVQREGDFIDFNEQRLLPHKLSEYGPGLASGDVNGDGTDDLLIGGTGDAAPTLLLQQLNGNFVSTTIALPAGHDVRRPESLGALLFDADGDGDLDLYLASGSNQFAPDTKNYQDWFFTNDGKGNFTFTETALPTNYTSKSCVKAADFDKDGDLDLFVGGRVLPGSYPLPVTSFIYRNDTKNGVIKFTDITKKVAPSLQNLGLTCDASWTDFDNDGWLDLVLAGEWMPLQFLKNNHGVFTNISAGSGINNEAGWWNSLTAGDFDNDGDIDYIAGNLGDNSFYRASHKYPVRIYAKDFDNNQSLDIVTTVYLPDENGSLQEYPAQTRDDQTEQLPGLKKRFLMYKDFGGATLADMFSASELKDALRLEANDFESAYIENKGNGKFECHALPVMAQLAPLYGMVADDFNHDGNLDIALTGNDFGTEVGNGRYDALNGLLMLGDGNGHFAAQSILQSGLFIPGNGKALIKLRGADNNYLLAASQNKGALKLFSLKTKPRMIPVLPSDLFCLYTLTNGKKRKEEFYKGQSFLSQSSPFILLNHHISVVEIMNDKGEKRMVR